MPAVGVRLCRPHIPAGREGRAGGGLGREGGGSATALRAPKSQRSVQGGRATGRASPCPGAEVLAESRRADDSGGQEVSHPGTGQVRGPGPPATPRTPARQKGWGGRGWEGALLGAGTKPQRSARPPRPRARGRICLWKEQAYRLWLPKPQSDPAPGQRSSGAVAGSRVWRLGGSGPVALPRPLVSTEPQQWQRVPAEGARGSPRPSVPQK